MIRALRAAALAVLLFPFGLAVHEVLHLAIYRVFGYDAVLQVGPWKLALVDFQLFGLHVTPLGAPPLALRILNDFLGPGLAAVLLAAVLSQVPVRAVREALFANVLVQVFFAVIEPAYLLLEHVAHQDADLLLSAELNYGAALLIIGAAITGYEKLRSVGLEFLRGKARPG